MRDSIETFNFIKKYHHDLEATLRGLRVSKPIHELTASDQRDWIVSSRFARIVLRDIGRFLLGIEEPQADFNFDDDPFPDSGRQEVERKAANPQGEAGDDHRDNSLAPVMRALVASGVIESTGQFRRSQRDGKPQRVFRSLIYREREEIQ
jgi:hypothetical protein